MQHNYLTVQGSFVETECNTKTIYFALKRGFDFLFSLCTLVILSPFMLIISLLIVLIDRIPPFYSMERYGIDGQIIKIFKFRTMVIDSDNLNKYFTEKELKEYYLNYKLENDKRITKLGRVLRKTSLDELPQLLNILIGSMSFVGPRPIVEKEKEKYGQDFSMLVSVKPGLTGYWQAYGRNKISYDDGKRQAMELKYVENCNMLFDIKIIFKTVLAVIKCDGAY